MAKGVVVIDPGHGGSLDVDGSSKNNATSPSGVLEKNMTLRFAFLVRDALQEAATLGGHDVKIFLTRDTDSNLGLAARAAVGKSKKADVFLSIHFNGFNGTTRGTETLISPVAMSSNHAADKALAQRVQKATFNAIKAHDAEAKDRKVKDQKLGVLNEASLGTKPRGCLVEIEFIDVPAVDSLLNIGPNSPEVRVDICKAIAGAILDDLIANP
ncbi:MAG: N-acetylmuramoyl-L-alanine amidase [Thermoanaerobaculia bacterium]